MKSSVAVRMSLREYSQHYLWTLTFPDKVSSPRDVSGRWGNFCDMLRRELKNRGWSNLKICRVYELHPGGHGFHVHFVCDRRLPVQLVRRLAIGCHFGRIHVAFLRNRGGEYIAKYLSKKRPTGMKGVRMYAHTGINNKNYTRQADLVLQCRDRSVYEQLRNIGYAKGTIAQSILPLFQYSIARYLNIIGMTVLEYIQMQATQAIELRGYQCA